MKIRKTFKLTLFLFVLMYLPFGIGYTQEVYLEAHFDVNANGFEYLDDAFLGTSLPADADGAYTATEGYSGGGLKVQLGAPGNSGIKRLSGGWWRAFTLAEDTRVQLRFRYNLTRLTNYQVDEYSQVLVSLDGKLFGHQFDAVDGHRYVDQVTRQVSQGTGWQVFKVELGLLAAGEHTLMIGGYSNHTAAQNSGRADLVVDDVIALQSTAQTVYPRVDPPSPTAASLGKFGDISVSLYTGTPNISVPLYEVKSRHLSIPLSLSYHASGVKAEDIASWVGLGWSLNSGGVITRTVRGMPDDNKAPGAGQGGYLYTSGQLAAVWDSLDLSRVPGTQTQNYLDDVSREAADSEPDNFFFNFAGRSGKLVMDGPNDIRTIPPQKIHFEFTETEIGIGIVTTVNVIKEWTVRTEDGTTYIFGGLSPRALETTENTVGSALATNPSARAFVSSWYLREIISPVGKDTIRFEYTAPNLVKHSYHNYKEKFNVTIGCTGLTTIESFSDIDTDMIRLSKITTPLETVVFSSPTLRDDALDPAGAPQEYQLDEIKIESNSGVLKKKFSFGYGYLNDSIPGPQPLKRLRLDTVIEIGSDGTTALPAYKFSYNENLSLPNRMTTGVDHWGFWNGKENQNDDLIPFFFDEDPYNPGQYKYFSGANREPDSTNLYAGILEEIEYPTGGRTKFIYEPHDYGKIESDDVQFTHGSVNKRTVTAFSTQCKADTFNIVAPAGEQVLMDLNAKLFLSGVSNNVCQSINDPCTNSISSCAYVELRGISGNLVYRLVSDNTSVTKPINPGTYYIVAAATKDTTSLPDLAAVATITWRDRIAAKTEMAGGLRIKRTEDYDEVNPIPVVREYQYELASDPGRSSGVLVSKPLYHHIVPLYFSCSYIARSSSSKTPLGTTQGSHLGYSEVTVLNGPNGQEGKSVHKFISADTFMADDEDLDETAFGIGEEYYAVRTRTSRDWKRGRMLERADYDQTGTLLKKEINQYLFNDEEQPEEVQTQQVQTKNFLSLGVKPNQNSLIPHFKRYEVISSWMYQTDQDVTTYDVGQPKITLNRDFFYDDSTHLQITKTIDKNNDGSQRITEFEYAHKYSQMAGNNVHMFSQPYSTTISDAANDLSKSWTTWAYNSADDVWRPYAQWVWKGTAGTAPPDTSGPGTIKTATFQSYDQFGNPKEILDAENIETTYTWEQNSTVLDKTTQRPDPNTQLVTDRNYDSTTVQLTEIIDPSGQKTTFEYDTFQRLIKTKNAAAQEVSIRDYFYSRTSSSADTFNVTEPNYVREKLVRGAGDSTIITAYLDGLGRQISAQVRDGNDDIVQYNTYDAHGRPDSSFKAFQITNSSHNFVQRSEFPANPLYQLTEYETNPLNRVSKVTPFGGGASVNFAYGVEPFNGAGPNFRYVQRTDEVGDVTKAYSDEFGRKVGAINGTGGKTEFLYNVLDNLTTSRPPNYFSPPTGSVQDDWITTYQYNTLSQLTQKTSPDAGTVQSLYDKKSNLRFSQDANQSVSGKVIFVTYDGINRPLITGEAETAFSTLDGHLTYSFETDSLNWLSLSLYDVTTPPTSFPWNLFDYTGITLDSTKGRLAAIAYNTVGGGGDELVENQGLNTTETFRALGSLTAQNNLTVASAANVTFKAGDGITLGDGFTVSAGASFKAVIDSVYNALQNSWQVTLFSYDNNGRVKDKYVFTACATSLDRTDFTYDYDRQGNVKHVKVLRGTEEIHHWNNFDERGLLKDVSVAQNSTQPSPDFVFTYTPTGLIKTKDINSNLLMSYEYHDRDWLKKINDVNSTAKPFAAEYLYEDDGNIETATFYNHKNMPGLNLPNKYSTTFTYDGRKQLTSADYSDGQSGTTTLDAVGFVYDANGNIKNLKRYDDSSSGQPIDDLSYNYGSNNQLDSVDDAVSTTTEDWDAEDLDYTYDANGNVKTVKEDNVYKFKSIQYDSRNLPIFIEKGDGTEVIYLYSADGQRILKKVDNNLAEHYIMDGSLTVGVFDENGSRKHWNIVGDGVAGRIEPDNSRLYYLTDHLGSTRAVIDESGTVQESQDYYAFGLLMPGRDFNAGTKELFTGKERDIETGWDYFGARYYDASIGRWLSVDALAGRYPNLSSYAYVANNPLILVDLDGRKVTKKGFGDFASFSQFKYFIDGPVGQYIESAFGSGGRFEGVDLTYKAGFPPGVSQAEMVHLRARTLYRLQGEDPTNLSDSTWPSDPNDKGLKLDNLQVLIFIASDESMQTGAHEAVGHAFSITLSVDHGVEIPKTSKQHSFLKDQTGVFTIDGKGSLQEVLDKIMLYINSEQQKKNEEEEEGS